MEEMQGNENVFFLTADLGFKLWDEIIESFPDRAFNIGSSEQLMMSMAVGLALKGKIPVVYSITPFLLYRPFEIIRTYINHENIPVKMVGSGRCKDYAEDGFTHWAEDDERIMSCFENIQQFHPESKEELSKNASILLHNTRPVYINLRK
jgi:transketolase